MKKMWIATAQVDVVVVADNQEEALRIASMHALDEMSAHGPDRVTDLNVVTESSQLTDDWLDAIPWGEENDATCAVILARRRNRPLPGRRPDTDGGKS